MDGKDWHFYFTIAASRILAAANFRRAFGQSLFLEVDERILERQKTLRGLDATIMKSGGGGFSSCYVKMLLKGKGSS